MIVEVLKCVLELIPLDDCPPLIVNDKLEVLVMNGIQTNNWTLDARADEHVELKNPLRLMTVVSFLLLTTWTSSLGECAHPVLQLVHEAQSPD